MLLDGTMQRLIDIGVRGVTANPSMFDQAITGSDDYDEQIRRLALDGCSAIDIFEALAIQDISQTADLFHPLYEESCRADGYVSLEVDPSLAYDTAGTIDHARAFARALNRPNVMIHVPATTQGIFAIEELLSDGISINATLIFGPTQYRQVIEAFYRGLEVYQARGGDVSRVASVASFVVSRIDTHFETLIEQRAVSEPRGAIAIACAKLAYAQFTRAFQGPRWEQLAMRGARAQRLLWASTSTKNPARPDTVYVEELIGPRTVMTMSLTLLDAFLAHGRIAPTLTQSLDDAQQRIDRLNDLGIEMDYLASELTRDGVQQSNDAFDHMISGIDEKRHLDSEEQRRAA
jgi:transaldolase